MSPRTQTKPIDDPKMWRRLIALTHPDRGGDGDVFIWVREVEQKVSTATVNGTLNAPSGISPEEVQLRVAQARAEGREAGKAEARAQAQRTAQRENPTQEQNASQDGRDRVPFNAAADFEELTDRALSLADQVEQPFSKLLRLLSDCEPSELHEVEQSRGASYKSLAALGHKAQMPKSQRVRWYRIAEAVSLSQRHVGHIISRLGEDG